MKIFIFLTICSSLLVIEGNAAKCMTPRDARFIVPMSKVPAEWKASAMWHTGDYFPSPGSATPRGILLRTQLDAARIWWVKDGESELYTILTQDQGSILCTLIGAGLQIGWNQVTAEAKRSGYCHWDITVKSDDPSVFQLRNHELSTIPDIGPVYLNRTGLYFDYASNSINDPANRVEESLKWWKWETDEREDSMREMSELPDECERGASGLPLFMENMDIQGRSVGGRRRRRRFKFSSEDKFARCNKQWFLHGNKCYRIFRAPGLQRSRSSRVCKILRGGLALPETDDENRFVRALCRRFAPRKRFWVRAKASDDVSNIAAGDFVDDGYDEEHTSQILKYSRIRSRRIMSTQRCSQIDPMRSINWFPMNCDDRTGRVLCERPATFTEKPSSLKCGRIQVPALDSLMSQIYQEEPRAAVSGHRSRIVGGDGAREGQFPWQVGIRYKEDQEIEGLLVKHFCGGALIDYQWVVSAAHCFVDKDPTLFNAVLGDLYNELEEGNEQTFEIVQAIVHEEYTNLPSHRNDIALLKLNSKAVIGPFVQPICLPTVGFRIRPDGERCQVSGWGLTDLERGQASAAKVLQYVTVPTIPDRVCHARYNRRTHYFVKGLMFCAGFLKGGKDSCSGDSGGPYVCRNNDGRYALAGIVSFGIGCAHKVYPGVYTNVRHYIPWITQKIKADGSGDLIT